jgi:hypothetical protein
MSAVEIHCELCAVYGQNIMHEGTLRQWHRMLKMGEQSFTMKSEVIGQPSVVSDDLVQSVDQKFVKDSASQFQNFHVSFHNLKKIITCWAIISFSQGGF